MGIYLKQTSIRRGRRAASLLAVLGTASALVAGCGGGNDGHAGPAGNGPVPPTVGPGGVQLSSGGTQGAATPVGEAAGTSVTLTKAERAARKGEAVKKAAGFDPKPNVARVVVPKADVKRTTHKPVRPVGHPDNQAPINESKHKKTSGQIAAAARREASSAANSPCRLVTRREASAILGRSVRQTLAPQGPTCIFTSGRQAVVTMSVQQVRFATILKGAKVVSHVRVGKHTIYCLKVGAQATYVPLSASRVLNVTGACATGTRFARKALSRV